MFYLSALIVWLSVSMRDLLSFLLFAILLVPCYIHYVRSPWRKLPPGPRGLPILGNIKELKDKQWLTSGECRATFGIFLIFSISISELWTITGDVVYLHVFGRSIVILNSLKAAADLLGRRAKNYSDRPRFIVAAEILTGGMEVSFLQYGML
jgi:hypothetical protein